ncbi:type II CAAX endopeptidase family protein [Providencia vermicola]|uniref:CPBP family intramembrane glutamic endopeptidase n=1 Tax=Providencia TaxID=586 RepID=UPI002348F479|nr:MULTISPECIES: type II CAAX endopeptidase family protein [Providencia]ELR5142065.1 CPBP family intramembrane metalloprotease [Providencia stuartii]WER21923.1 type II CAAX endopeptidase family protein [Providencia stuartii]WER26044.1 type II CAAX endopeptidase family protein [Providencia stuartii]WER30133.1 type II CAAX endopeptidase family protein [Providencia stuartii]
MNPPKSRIAHSLICLSAFVAWYLSPFFVLLMPDANNLLTSAYAFPFISILLMLPCALICWSYYQKRFNLMPIGKIDWQALILPIFALIGLMFLNALFGVEEEWVKSVSHISGLVFFLYVIALIIAAPIGEEIIFRGFLLNAGMWYGARGKWLAIFASSFLFSSVHSQYTSFSTFIILMIMGAIFCHVRIHTRTLIAPILLHALNNTAAVLFMSTMSF